MVNIKKKLGFLILTITLIAIGVFFYWKNLQTELVSLNESLPEDITITKTLTGDYKITNKIDGYSFKAPVTWDGIKEIEYTPEMEEEGYSFTSINFEGKIFGCGAIAISKVKSISKNDLITQATSFFNTFGLVSEFDNKNIGKIKTIISKENAGFIGSVKAYLFQKENYFYVITCCSGDFIEEIIINGTW